MGRTLYALSFFLLLAAIWAYIAPIDITVDATGTVEPDAEITRLTADVEGRIAQIHKRDGEPVRAGDPVIQLDTRDLEFKQRRLEARIHAMESRAHDRDALLVLYQQLDDVQVNLTRRTLTSPADGVIVSMAALHPGDFLAPGASIATIVPAEHDLIIVSHIQPADRDWIVEGQPVRISSRYESFNGLVVSTRPDNRVLVVPVEDSLPLRAGMTFRLHFITYQQPLISLLFERLHGQFSK